MPDLQTPDTGQYQGIEHTVVRGAFDNLFHALKTAPHNIEGGVKLWHDRQPIEGTSADPYRMSDEQLATLNSILQAIGVIPNGAIIHDARILIRTSGVRRRSDTVKISGYFVLDKSTYPIIGKYATSGPMDSFYYQIVRDRGDDKRATYDEFTLFGSVNVPTITFHTLDGVETDRLMREIEEIREIWRACNLHINLKSKLRFFLESDLALLNFLKSKIGGIRSNALERV